MNRRIDLDKNEAEVVYAILAAVTADDPNRPLIPLRSGDWGIARSVANRLRRYLEPDTAVLTEEEPVT